MNLVRKVPEKGFELPVPTEFNGVRLEVVNDSVRLQKFSRDWNRLVEEAGQRPELSYSWLSCYLETRLMPGDSWFCLLAFDGAQLVGVLPIVVVPRCWLGRGSCLRFETPYDILTTGSVEALLRPGYEGNVFSMFLEYLWSIPASCSCLRFRGLPESRLPELKKLCGAADSVIDFDGSESVIPVRGTAEEFIQSLSRKFRQNYRRIGRRIQEQPGVRFRFESGNMEENAAAFMRIEHAGWKAQRKTSILSDESYIHFFLLMAKRMEDQGWLRWAFLDIGGRPVAGQFMVECGNTLYVVKIGFDEAFSNLSPGTALFGKVIEETLSAGRMKEINFMSGYPWMKDWNVQTRPIANVAFFPKKFLHWSLCKQPMKLRAYINRFPALRKVVDDFSNRLLNPCP
ncbi:MAG: GNAT family N-acetyltransferase [Kiritimatiellales bacterium]